MKIGFVMLMCIAALAPVAQAETVWRCGPEGRSYSAQPCRDGRSLDVADVPRASARDEALALARREREVAKSMAQDRREREREALAAGAGPAGIKTLPLPPEAPRKPTKPRRKAPRHEA